jgi:hypothetical protein
MTGEKEEAMQRSVQLTRLSRRAILIAEQVDFNLFLCRSRRRSCAIGMWVTRRRFIMRDPTGNHIETIGSPSSAKRPTHVCDNNPTVTSRFVLLAAFSLLASGCKQGNEVSVAYPDSTLMQAADTKIVYIILGGKRHRVPDPQTLGALGVSGQVSMEAPDVIAKVPEGEPIPHLPGKVIQKGGTGEVFMLEAGKRRWIPDRETLEALGGAAQVHGVPNSVADSFPLGSPMPHMSKSDGQPQRPNQ